jgi:hypothetical protein
MTKGRVRPLTRLRVSETVLRGTRQGKRTGTKAADDDLGLEANSDFAGDPIGRPGKQLPLSDGQG